jgi:hypothetical protein
MDNIKNPATEERQAITPFAPKAYTIPEAAILLRMCEKSVRRQIERGNLRKCRKFGRVLIPKKDVDTFFDSFSE